ncbi:Zinc resistance conferring protein [Microbotryomycetes sp. JL221]|nr:Zinc resistance conferring protein [Microbotryomycetes sp. JL221]
MFGSLLYSRELAGVDLQDQEDETSFTYGFERVQVVANLIQGSLLMALCLTLWLEGMQRMYAPETVLFPPLVIGIGLAALVWNCLNLVWFSRDSHMGHSHSLGHLNGIVHPIEYRQRAILAGRASRFNFLHSLANGHSHTQSHSHIHTHNQDMSSEGELSSVPLERSNTGFSRSSSQIREDEQHVADSHKHPMTALAVHALGDAVANLAVIFDGIMFLLLGPKKSWYSGRAATWDGIGYIDPICTLAVLYVILRHSFPLVTASSYMLMQAIEPDRINAYRRILDDPRASWLEGSDVRARFSISYDNLRVWSIDSDHKVAQLRIVLHPRQNHLNSHLSPSELNQIIRLCKRNVFGGLRRLKQIKWLIDSKFVTVEVVVAHADYKRLSSIQVGQQIESIVRDNTDWSRGVRGQVDRIAHNYSLG